MIVVPARAGTHCRSNGFPLARERRDFQESRGVEGAIQEIGLDGYGLPLFDSRLTASRLEFDGTKRECL